MEKLVNRKDKIFIAGHKGMAGSAIMRSFFRSGYFQPSCGGSLLTASRDELDLLDESKVNKWFKKNTPDVVIIAAAKVGGIFANSQYPFEFISENLRIQQNIIENAWKNGTKRLLFLGSSCIYPKFSKQPINENYLLTGVLETTNESYAIAKIAGIKLCEALRKQYGFDAISIMPTNLYGPGDNYHYQNSHVFASFVRRFLEAKENDLEQVICWGTGSPYREFLHVDDLGDACIFLLENWDPNNTIDIKNSKEKSSSIINVGSGKDLTIKTLAEKIAKEVGYKGEIYWDAEKADGTPRKKLDISKLKSLGWEPSITLEDGIKRTVEEYKKLHSK